MKCVLTGACLAWACLLLTRSAVVADEPNRSADRPVAARPWAHEQSDLKPDARVVWGSLDNGLRYAILPTDAAPGRGSLRMLILAGSAMEDDDQQGLAHFLEHMAFNGTKHFAAGETFEYFQRLGMAFGAHTNAETQVDHTTYQLELPRTDERLTADGLRLFRDFLDGMLLDPQEFESERGVVLSEQTARNTAAYRAAVGNLRASLAGTKAAERMPLGTVESVRRLEHRRVVDFYETWYTPGRTVIVAVGDFKPETVEREIRRQFADARARRGETPDPDLGRLAPGKGLTARYNFVPDAGSTIVNVFRLRPTRGRVECVADQRREIVDLMVRFMLGQRLEKLANAPDAPMQSTNVDETTLYNLVRRGNISAECRPEQWQAAVGLLRRELRRAVEHGFTAGELDDAKRCIRSVCDMIVMQADSRQPDKLADEIVESVVDPDVFSHPASFVDLLHETLAAVDADECHAALNDWWRTDDLEISLTGNVRLGDDAGEQIVAAFRAADAEVVEAVVDTQGAEFAYTDFGAAGEIVTRREHADLGVAQVEFTNGVRVNIKPTPFEKGKINTLFRIGGGLLEMPADKPGLQFFARSAFISGGLHGMSLVELNRQIGDKQVSIAFDVGDDAFQIGGPCSSRSLELQLQVCTAYLTAPGFAPETERQFFEQMAGVYAERSHTLEGMMRYDGAAVFRSNDARFVLPTQEELSRLTLNDVKSWLTRPFAEGYLEVTLVGDVDVDAALPLLAKTVGALPRRDAAKPGFGAARRLQFPAVPHTYALEVDSDMPRSVATVCWPAPGSADIARCRRVGVLTQVLNDRLRLKIREELAAAYTPSVAYSNAHAYPEFGFVGAQLLVEPARLEEIAQLTVDVAAELGRGSISDDEFERAIRPIISGIESQQRNNGYWISVLCDCQERPAALEQIRRCRADYEAVQKSELEALAKELLVADRAAKLLVAPAAAH